VVQFEVLERDGLARIGRLVTPHGAIETPALLPVVHPDPERQSVPVEAMVQRLGVGAVITSSYIVHRTPPLRERAEREGIHGLLGFEGPVMTDSGAFQQHAYGSVEVGPEEILRFQGAIGSDIATVLDLFTEPESTHETAEHGLATTLARAEAARRERSGLLAVPVQGGAHDDLRARSAARASEIGDVLAIGGVVPLMERYRFPDLARVLLATRPCLSPGRPVHLFGTGHPMAFAWAALAGIDLFDSSAYHKFARRGDLLTVEGTVAIDDLREPICRCFLCAELPLTEVARLTTRDREQRIALHNLAASVEEIGRVRQAIREGTLWELAERRAGAHPALRAGLVTLRGRPEIFLPTEPESRRAFREIDPGSRERPAVVRFRQRLRVYLAGRAPALELPRVPLRPEYLRYVAVSDETGGELHWSVPSPLGPVPLELTDLYPVGPYLGEAEFLDPRGHLPPSAIEEVVHQRLGGRRIPEEDWTDAWTRRQIAAVLEWQYGPGVAAELAPRLRGDRSPRSGRLRGLRHEGAIAFHVGVDGVARPTFGGAKLLHGAVPLGRHRLVVADDAAPFVRSGRTLFARFVVGSDPAMVPGASVLLVDRSDRLLAVGRLLLAPHEIPFLERGVAAWITSHAKSPAEALDEEPPDGPARAGTGRGDQTL
jgi:7-cyano-7-deazaguanine tRNA-ribosyltransferase